MVTILVLAGIIIIIFTFPEKWIVRIEKMFEKVVGRNPPRIIDVKKICKDFKKHPER